MRWFISILVVLALVAGLWWMEQRQQAELAPESEIDIPDTAQAPEPRYPLPEPEPQQPPVESPGATDPGEPVEQSEPAPEPAPPAPLPALAESDPAASDELSGLFGPEWVDRWLRPEFVISRTAAIVNSLDGAAPALKARPLNTLDAEPVTRETGESLLWSEANAERYAGLVAALESVSPDEAAKRYARYYPLFQRAWDELGEPEPYFNDRLVDVIDHLLAAPEVQLPFEVVPYEGRLHFADEALQEASWGHKLLIRMGPENATTVKSWLEAFRRSAAGTGGVRENDTSQPLGQD